MRERRENEMTLRTALAGLLILFFWPGVAEVTTDIKGEYLGEEKPGLEPKLFAPGIISSPDWEHSPVVFSGDGREVYWSVVSYKNPNEGVILYMEQKDGRWSSPRPLAFSEWKYRDICPSFSLDGSRLFFTSCRPLQEGGKIGDYNIWSAEREGRAWSKPQPFDPIVNSGKEARALFAEDGTIYFGSWRKGGIGTCNVYRSRHVGGKYTDPENLGRPVNNDLEMPAVIAPDESFLIFESIRSGGCGGWDFWLSYLQADGTWSEPSNLGEPVNSKGNDWFGGLSPDGKYFFFVSDRGGNDDIYWVDVLAIRGIRK
jgi:Tol biopolymer transport system component